MTPKDEILRRFLRLSAVGYTAGALAFLFGRKRVETSLSVLDRGKQSLDEGFWPVLAAAYMSTIGALAWTAGADRRLAEKMTPALLIAKGTTASAFAVRFARTRRLSYLVSAITDASLFGAMAYLWRRARGPHLKSVAEIRGIYGEAVDG